ncbi:MAG: glycosyltransferase [Prevotella sp.]|nr:glycosyltransferase [Prevotella sp.]
MENTKPLISFIIPIYNVPTAMLRECLESILALSLRPFEREIIIVDDGSETSPLAELGTMADDLLYIRQHNAGVSVARNAGLRMATGRFIQFVDGDDLLLQAPYEHVLDQLRYQQSCDMVLFDFAKTRDVPLLYDDTGPMSGSELLRRENIHGSVCGYSFSRSILGSLRFTPGVNYGEDEEFTPQLILRAECAIRTTAQAYFYRERKTSATGIGTTRSNLRRLIDTKDVIIRLKKLADRMPTADRVAMQRRTAQLTMDYIYNVIVMTRSSHYLERKIGELSKAGLFPLPNRDYTTKYTWFRRMTNSRVGRAMLLRTLPLMERER